MAEQWNYTIHPDADSATGHPPEPAADSALLSLVDPHDRDTLSDPALTGMSRDAFAALVEKLAALHDASGETHLRESRGQQRRPGMGRPLVLTFPDRVLVGILRLRLQIPETILAGMFQIGRTTIHRSIMQTRRLLQRHGSVIEPVSVRPPILSQLLAVMADADRVEIKPAC